MRKKSHISLAGFLVKGLDDATLSRRWKAFYVGSLLPDCRPSFLTRRHEYEETIDLVEKKIRRLVGEKDWKPVDSMRYMVDLGQVCHYLADYFTYPHNQNYPGSLKDHCLYEKYLKFQLRSYIREGDAVFCKDQAGALASADDILKFIRENHKAYVQDPRSVEEDCEYITRVCSQVLDAIARLAPEPVLAYAA
jgi:hypothetical protein